MLVPLRFGTTEPPIDADSPFHMLRECHGRIRNFLRLARLLLEADGARGSEVADVARSLVRYFTLGLGKHVADEDLSLAPRLRALSLPPEAREALEAMEAQHRIIGARVDGLVARWRQLEVSPAPRPSSFPTLREDTDALCLLMEEHLQLEERVLLPVAGRLLAPREQQALRGEMLARRGMMP